MSPRVQRLPSVGSRVRWIPLLVGVCAIAGLGIHAALWDPVDSRAAGVRPLPGAEKGTAGCVPSCKGKSCGSDGCGGSCGTCGKSKLCLADRCVRNTTPKLCSAIAGAWSGVIKAPQTHYLSGRVFRKKNTCHARFRITFVGDHGQGWVVEDFAIHFTGLRVRLIGTRIVRASPNSRYNRDRFTGQLNTSGNRFTGTNKDTLNQRAAVVLTKP